MQKKSLIFIFWIVPVLGIITYLGGLHIALRAPATTGLLTDNKDYFKTNNSLVKVAHILSKNCGCSKRVAKHLLNRGTLPLAEEVIFMVDGDLPNLSELSAKGFQVQKISSEFLERNWGIDALPLLQVSYKLLDYSGGYQDSKSNQYFDQAIIQSLQNGQTKEPLPVFGCASSRKLAQKIDPFGLKYTGETP